MMELATEIRELIGKYGLLEVHKCLEKEMKATYVYLKMIYGNEQFQEDLRQEKREGGGNGVVVRNSAVVRKSELQENSEELKKENSLEPPKEKSNVEENS